jgi:hypothetical protein
MNGLSISLLYLGSRVVCSPLEALFSLLIFIISKDSNAGVWPFTVIACAKPIVSLAAFFASSFLAERQHRIRQYLLVTNTAGCLPCLFFPFIENVWFYVFSYALFIATQRASFPAWNEVLKTEAGIASMRGLIAKGTSIQYFAMICLPLCFSFLLDRSAEIWKLLFCFMALFQLINNFFVYQLKASACSNHSILTITPSFRNLVVTPWKTAMKLLKERPDYAHYLFLFFLGGAGLIAIQPIVPVFFREQFNLSYTELAFAFCLCKGVGFLLSSGLWARMSHKISLYFLNCWINFFSCLFLLLLTLSASNIVCLYTAYFFYGIMQAGCEISWNLSGPVFSQEKESVSFSNLNLALVGIRGCSFPILAQGIYLCTDAQVVFVCASILCFISLVLAFHLDQRYSRTFKQDMESRYAA